jgi:hypothetical protein
MFATRLFKNWCLWEHFTNTCWRCYVHYLTILFKVQNLLGTELRTGLLGTAKWEESSYVLYDLQFLKSRSGFPSYVVTHFNAIVLISSDWFWWIWLRSHGWQVSFLSALMPLLKAIQHWLLLYEFDIIHPIVLGTQSTQEVHTQVYGIPRKYCNTLFVQIQ